MRCANGFAVTNPSLYRSFIIRHAISLPLRCHYRTQTLETSRGTSHMEVLGLARVQSMHVRDVFVDIINYNNYYRYVGIEGGKVRRNVPCVGMSVRM